MAVSTAVASSVERRRSGTRRDDLLDGTDGRDLLLGGWGADALHGGRGDDRLYGEGGDDRLDGGAGDDFLDGGPGVDLASFAGAATGVAVDLRAGMASGEGSDRLLRIEDIEGSAWGDLLVGNGLANRLAGGGGDDTLMGAAGNDALDGGLGDDLLRGGSGDDRLDGGAGRDTASYADAAFGIAVVGGPGPGMTVTGGAGTDTLRGIEVVEGSRYADAMVGHLTAAEAGADPVDQVFRGMAGNDDLAGGAGNDVLEGGSGDDVLCGDYAPGPGGDDRLDGGSGQDRLLLDEAGRDLHVGGSGRDVFELYQDSGRALSGADVIADFARGQDLLRLILDDGAGGTLDGAGLLALLDRGGGGGDGRLGAGDAGGTSGGWSVSVADVTLGDTTSASLLIEAQAGSAVSADGYVLCLFGVTELSGADFV